MRYSRINPEMSSAVRRLAATTILFPCSSVYFFLFHPDGSEANGVPVAMETTEINVIGQGELCLFDSPLFYCQLVAFASSMAI